MPSELLGCELEDIETMSIYTSITTVVGLALLGGVAAATDRVESGPHHDGASRGRLVQLVREATRPFIDVKNATDADYAPATGCVSGPQEGAMGVHYINGSLLLDGELDVSRPEALLYEIKNGHARLLGVEFIVDAAAWLAQHKVPPVLEGQHFHYVGSPNRYGLAPFFELHVWAWRDNPSGAFVDWNTRVSCEGQ